MTGSGSGTHRRELVLTLACCAAGAGLILLAGSRSWVSVTVSRPSPLPPIAMTGSGGAIEPVVSAFGVVGLAGVVGLLATRRTGRLVLGVVLAVAGIVVVVRALPHLGAPSRQQALDLVTARGRTVGLAPHAPLLVGAHPLWPLLAAIGGLGLAAGGTLAAWRGRRWPGMSGRYDAPAGRSAPVPEDATAGVRSNAEMWDEIDDGRDPTRF